MHSLNFAPFCHNCNAACRSVQDEIIARTSSGSVCVNDLIVQLSVETLPFGGVGASGHGAYHGKYTFDTFSHRKSVLKRTSVQK